MQGESVPATPDTLCGQGERMSSPTTSKSEQRSFLSQSEHCNSLSQSKHYNSLSRLSASKLGHSRHVSFLSCLSGLADLTRNSSGVFCRICHEGEQGGESLISPCRCSGTVGVVHRSCVEKWLSTANQDTCEICQQKYSVARHPRPFVQWLCEAEVGDDHQNLLGDFVCFLLLTPLAAISTYLCASGAAFYFQDKQSEAVGLICLTSLLVLIYLLWLLLSVRYHCQVWFKWRLNHQDIRLLEEQQPQPNPQTTYAPRVPEESRHVSGSMSPISVSPLLETRSPTSHHLTQLAEDSEVYTLVKPQQVSNEVLQHRDSLMSDLRHHLLTNRQVVTQISPEGVGAGELGPGGEVSEASITHPSPGAVECVNTRFGNGQSFEPPVTSQPFISTNILPSGGQGCSAQSTS